MGELEGVGVRGDRGGWAVREASLAVRRGEIVGIAGVEGNGQRELALLLSGRLAPDEGRARLPEEAGFVPQDRTTEGLVGGFDLVENVALALHDRAGDRRWLMPWAEARRRTESICSEYGVVARDSHVRVSTLSGGNQQRLVVGRELGRARDLLVAENPTRGLDIAATAFVRGELRRRVRGIPPAPGVVLISSDLDEVLALSDRVLVMVRGRLIEVPELRLSREGIGAMMLGAPARARLRSSRGCRGCRGCRGGCVARWPWARSRSWPPWFWRPSSWYSVVTIPGGRRERWCEGPPAARRRCSRSPSCGRARWC